MVTRRWMFLYVVLAIGLFLIVVAWSARLQLESGAVWHPTPSVDTGCVVTPTGHICDAGPNHGNLLPSPRY